MKTQRFDNPYKTRNEAYNRIRRIRRTEDNDFYFYNPEAKKPEYKIKKENNMFQIYITEF